MTPVHKNPSYKNRVAVAPYNFVPLPEKILTLNRSLPPHDRYDPKLFTGTLKCTLTTASPLYVRAARTWEQYTTETEPPADPFYGETKDTLLIPGSSLRGMLRNLVEVISYSRIAPVTTRPLFFRTVDVSSIGKAYGKRMSGGDAGEQGWFTLARAGYMELRGGDFFIRPAREIFGTQHFRVDEDIALQARIPGLRNLAIQNENGRWGPNRTYHWVRHPVWFRPVAPTSHLPTSPTFYADVVEIRVQDLAPDGPGWEQGYFVASGWVPSPKGGKGKRRHWIVGPPTDDENQLILVSDEDIDLYRASGRTQAIDREKKSVLPVKEDEKIPCFYTFWQDEDGRQRVAFGHTGMFRLPYQQSPSQMLPGHLLNVDGYDLAEALFGFVDQSSSQREAVAGRVFITDARLEGDPTQAVMDERVLSDQALSSPKPTTVQHYLAQSDPDHPENLKHYDSNPNTETHLRGHKFYWHVGASGDVDKRLARSPKQRPGDKSNRFRPVKEGQSFTFEIHFENLLPEELGALLWVLDKAEAPEYRLKLGMGKPYGLGSIAITYELLLTDRQMRYGDLFKDDSWNEGTIEKDPGVDQAKASFEQYVLNNKEVNPNQCRSIDELPRIRELLALLTWQGSPAEDKTRYMELNEFTGRKHIFPELKGRPSRRPVLPEATKVIDNHWFARLPEEEPRTKKGSGGGGQVDRTPAHPVSPRARSYATASPKIPTAPAQKRTPPPPRERPVPVDKEPAALHVGDVIEGIVEETVGAGKEVSLFLPRGGDEDRAIIPAGTTMIHRFKKGEKVLLQVMKIEGNVEIGYIITCQPV